MLLRKLLGHDIFISYSRADRKYAKKLKEQLSSMDYSCFIDYEKVFPGERLNGALKQAIRWSSVFVLVGTDNSRKSRYVAQEVEEFIQTRRAMVPIFLGGALAKSDWAVIHDDELVWVDEPNADTPSPIVFDEIDRLFKHNRVKVWRRTAGTTLTLVLLAISVFAVLQAREARAQQALAERKTADLVAKQRELEVSTARLTRQQELLKKQNEELEKGRVELEKKTEEAGANAERARLQEQLARANAERAREQERIANERQKLALSRGLASSAMSQLQVDPELGLMLATEAVSVNPNAQSESTLRRALVESQVRAVARDAEGGALSPDGRLLVTAHNTHKPDPTRFVGALRVQEVSTGRELAELSGDGKYLSRPSFSPDGHLVVALCGAREACVFEVGAWRMLAELRGHEEKVNSAGFSHDGRFVVTASDDNTARVWEASTGHAAATLRGASGSLFDARFSPDDKLVVASGSSQRGWVWEVSSGKVLKEFPEGETSIVVAPAWSPDGKYLLTATHGSPARLWSTADWQVVRELDAGHPIQTAFSADGKHLLTVGEGYVQVWEMGDGERVGRFGDAYVHSAAFSPDGEFIVTGAFDGKVGVWSYYGAPLAIMQGHAGWVTDVTCSEDGRWVVTTGHDKSVRLWDSGQGAAPSILRGYDGKWLGNLANFSPDGEVLVTTGGGDTIRIWEASTGKLLHFINESVGASGRVVFSPDSRFFLTADENYVIHMWEVSSGRGVADFKGHKNSLSQASFSPDGKAVVTMDFNGEARVWEVATGKILFRLSDPISDEREPHAPYWDGEKFGMAPPGFIEVKSAAFSPDGKLLATGHGDKGLRVWDAHTGRNLFVIAESKKVGAIRFSPDGGLVVTYGGDTAHVWETGTWRGVAELRAETGSIAEAYFSADGKSVVTWSNDPMTDDKWVAREWEVGTWQSFVFAEFRGVVYAFSPDRRFALIQNDYPTMAVLELSTGLKLAVLPMHEGYLFNARFSPDGKHVFTANYDGTADIYPCELCASAEDLLSVARRRLGRIQREFTAEERLKYLQGLPRENAATNAPKPSGN